MSDWSDDPTAVIVLAATATLRLEVRCGDCAGPCTGSDTTTVDVDPALVPADLGNTLLCARVGSDVELRWAATTLAASYSLFRSESKGAWAGPIESGLLVVASTRADVPGPPKLYFYRAAAANCAGTHGP